MSSNGGGGNNNNKPTPRRHKSVLHPLCLSASFAIVIIILVLATRHHHTSSSNTSSQQQRFTTQMIRSQLTPSYVNLLDDRHPTTVYDVVVVGCGPAGLTASMYASRMGLSCLVIGSPSSGSLSGTDTLDNYPSFSVDKGGGQMWLDATMAQAISFGTKFVDPIWLATGLEQVNSKSGNNDCYLHITLSSNDKHDAASQTLQTKSVILATGSSPRKLGFPHEAELWGRSLHNCALCDGDLYASRSSTEGKNQKSVAVIGGGDAALEAVSLLSRLGVANIHWIHRRNEFRARQSTVGNVIRNLPNVKIWQPFVVTEWVVNEEIAGRKVLEGVRIVGSNVDGVADPEATSSLTIPCDGVFLMIGSTPNTNWLQKSDISLDSTSGLIQLASAMNETPELPPSLSTSTSLSGVFAAGEVVDDIYRQALTASSDGAKAAMDVERYLRASSFEVAGVDVVEHVVARDVPPVISSDETVQQYINCDLTNVDCIKTLVSKHTVVVFSKPFCPYCRQALEALRSEMRNGESPFVVDLTEMGEVGWRVQQALGALTGRRTVPNVFVNGKYVGGGDETVALHREGKLSRLIAGDA